MQDETVLLEISWWMWFLVSTPGCESKPPYSRGLSREWGFRPAAGMVVCYPRSKGLSFLLYCNKLSY